MLSARHFWSLAFCAAVSATTFSCREEEQERGPAEVVKSLVDGMGRLHGDAERGDAVVELLWQPARENLSERARRASALSGREISPGELIVPSWFSLHLVPERYETRQQGQWAEVTSFASDGRSVDTRCVLEEDGWKIALELPPLPPIRQRDEPAE